MLALEHLVFSLLTSAPTPPVAAWIEPRPEGKCAIVALDLAGGANVDPKPVPLAEWDGPCVARSTRLHGKGDDARVDFGWTRRGERVVVTVDRGDPKRSEGFLIDMRDRSSVERISLAPLPRRIATLYLGDKGKVYAAVREDTPEPDPIAAWRRTEQISVHLRTSSTAWRRVSTREAEFGDEHAPGLLEIEPLGVTAAMLSDLRFAGEDGLFGAPKYTLPPLEDESESWSSVTAGASLVAFVTTIESPTKISAPFYYRRRSSAPVEIAEASRLEGALALQASGDYLLLTSPREVLIYDLAAGRPILQREALLASFVPGSRPRAYVKKRRR